MSWKRKATLEEKRQVKKRPDNTEKRMSVGREMSRKKGDE
jgi:hypothetical protein